MTVHRRDQIARFDPRTLGRRVRITLATRSPRLTPLTVSPTPSNGPEVRLELLQLVGSRRREVVVVAISQLADHAVDRRVVDL